MSVKFRFQTGSIKRCELRHGRAFPATFRFQTGSIKSFILHSRAARYREFRFQTGSIKSTLHIQTATQAMRFRFQTGSIKSPERAYKWVRESGFDSKLVRLKVGHASGILEVIMFRFQTGSIKSYALMPWYVSVGTRFDSKLVRLKG